MDIRLTKIFSAAAIAQAAPDKRAVCKQLKQFGKEARAQGLFALAGEACQMRWQLVAELQRRSVMAMSNWSQLLAYVMKFGPLNQQQAEQWLDSRCPQWRSGPDVMAAGQIWTGKAGVKGERNQEQ